MDSVLANVSCSLEEGVMTQPAIPDMRDPCCSLAGPDVTLGGSARYPQYWSTVSSVWRRYCIIRGVRK